MKEPGIFYVEEEKGNIIAFKRTFDNLGRRIGRDEESKNDDPNHYFEAYFDMKKKIDLPSGCSWTDYF